MECDALVLATHDASLAASAVRSIGTLGAADADAAVIEQRALGDPAACTCHMYMCIHMCMHVCM